jgi:hypothetical protein
MFTIIIFVKQNNTLLNIKELLIAGLLFNRKGNSGELGVESGEFLNPIPMG